MTTSPDTTTFLAERTLIGSVFEPAIAVTVAGGRITSVGSAREVPPDANVRHLPRRLLMPGTINAHNHSFQSLLRGVADDCNFFTWRDKALYGYTPRMDEAAVYAGARFAFAEMLRNGVTTVCDFFYIHSGGNTNDHAVIRAARDLGMRIVLGRTMYDWNGAPEHYQETIAEAVARTRELWQHYRGSETVTVLPAPHSPHGASPEMIVAGSKLAEELGTRFHIHVAEGRYERDMIHEKWGKTPIRWLESLGVALERMTIIHGCWLEDDDISLMGKRDVRLVYNPASNMFLGDGVTPLPKMLDAGVRMGLGSDGGCSNNRVSVFDEMRMCSLLQKVTYLSSEVLPAETALRMGTLGSAESVDLPAGEIANGKLADFVLLDMDDPSLQPSWAWHKQVVYAMTPHAIAEVIVGGETVFRDAQLVKQSWQEVIGAVRDVTAAWPNP
ncbi:MAG TPA: amidohydrolase [Ktedonobacterales bacterium]